MNATKSGGTAVFTIGLTLVAPVALAAIFDIDPDMDWPADDSFRPVTTVHIEGGTDVEDVNHDMFESNDRAVAFDERCRAITANSAPPSVDYGSTAGEQAVQCHLLHLDPIFEVPPPEGSDGIVEPDVPILRAKGKIEFDDDVVAIVWSSGLLGQWDTWCGHPDVDYPEGASTIARALEYVPLVEYAAFDPSNSKAVLYTMYTDLHDAAEYDNLRVITTCPVP